MLYGLEACPLTKTSLRSLDFPVNRFFMKLFNICDMQTVTECQLIFGLKLSSAIIADRSKIFLTIKRMTIAITFCSSFLQLRFLSMAPRPDICAICWHALLTYHLGVVFVHRLPVSVRFVGGLGGGFNPHWLKMTPTLVTENFGLGGRLRPPPSPDPARPT